MYKLSLVYYYGSRLEPGVVVDDDVDVRSLLFPGLGFVLVVGAEKDEGSLILPVRGTVLLKLERLFSLFSHLLGDALEPDRLSWIIGSVDFVDAHLGWDL